MLSRDRRKVNRFPLPDSRVQKYKGGGGGIRTPDTTGMNRVLWPTELRRHHKGKSTLGNPHGQAVIYPFFAENF
jgi:hypothetical protein